ncbi:AIG2-like protein D [Sesamum angolense]|uniref:Putative gamma-glutamylcyclotransferase n=1 Tax=Sesamum angolense TaxID=2727404 RepID=A0AAE1W958_9LAMI|nr:AIG2-like protein D [Sesamum angolense]
MGSASAANPAATISTVFVYGSLLADDVVRVLLNRVPPSSSAILHDYHRFSIKGRVYPAILPAENKKVIGRDTAEKLKAYTYVWETRLIQTYTANGILRSGKYCIWIIS